MEADQFGDNWLTFESTLASETAGSFVDGNYISQWYQLLDAHHGHGGEEEGHEGHDHRALEGHGEDEAWYETVQATLLFDSAATTVAEANATLQQTCGAKLQDTWVDTGYAGRAEAIAGDEKCSPWLSAAGEWAADAEDVKAVFKRKLIEEQLSDIALKAGTYSMRGGFFVQTSASVVTGQASGFAENLELTIADSAMQGLAAGILCLSAALAF